MKLLFSIMLLLVQHTMISQDTTSRFSMGIIAGLDWSYRRLDFGDDVLAGQLWDSLESPVFRGSVGMRLHYTISDRFELFTGLGYADRGYAIDTLQENGMFAMKFHYQFLEVPFGASFSQKLTEKASLLAGASISANFLLRERMDYRIIGQTADFSLKNVQELNTTQWNVSLLLGLRRNITNTASIDILLRGNQSLTPLSDGALSRYLNSLGLYLICRRFF